jgi:hypothetical protein
MYSKSQASQIRHEFWTAFGLYMSPISSSEGDKINWVNYKTGYKNLYFRMDAGSRSATIGIEITHPDPVSRSLFYERFTELKQVLHSTLEEQWTWEPDGTDETGKSISRIYKESEAASIFNKSDWPVLISFFKPRIILLDEFWSQVKDIFEDLRNI